MEQVEAEALAAKALVVVGQVRCPECQRHPNPEGRTGWFEEIVVVMEDGVR